VSIPDPLRMVPLSVAAPTTGAHKALPVVSLPRELHPDPIRSLLALLDAGLSPEQVFPIEKAGLQTLLHATKLAKDVDDEAEAERLAELAECRHIPSRFDALPAMLTQPAKLVQEAMRRQLKGDPSAPRSAIRVHLTLEGLIGAAQATLCPFNALRSARIICRTKEAKDHWEWLIEAGRAEEFQDPTREPEPAVLLIDELQQQQFQEIFLAPDIDPRTTSKEELMRAVSAARVGLYLIKQPTQG
jgi:hypothetical protein